MSNRPSAAPPDSRRYGTGLERGPDHQFHRPVRLLRDRQVSLEPALLLERLVPDIAHNPDDAMRTVDDRYLAHGVPARPQPSRGLLIDQDHLFAVGRIPLREVAPGDQRNMHCADVPPVDHARMRERRLALPIIHALREQAPRPVAAERQRIGDARRRHPGHALDSAYQPVIELRLLQKKGLFNSESIKQKDKYLIPYSVVNGHSGRLEGFKPDYIRIHLDKRCIETDRAVVALCDNKLSNLGEYNGLLSRGILQYMEGNYD